jgi:Zn-dependent protease with chaperone function
VIEASLLLYALLLSLIAPRGLVGGWTVRHPGVGLLAWHVVVGTVITSGVSAALIGTHDVWKPIATLVFQVDPPPGHSHPVSTAVSHEWDASLLVLCVLAARLLFVTVRQVRLHRGERANIRCAVTALSVPRRGRGPNGVTIIDLPEPTAFCVPGRRPLIVFSEVALQRLSPDQVGAVVAHEQAHLRHRHAALATWTSLLVAAFPQWALFGSYARTVPRLHEMYADDVAARVTSRRTVTASLLALAHSDPDGALAMSGGDVAARGLRLLSPTPRSRVQLVAVAAALVLVLALPVSLIAGPGLSSVASDHHPDAGHLPTSPL